MFRAFGLVTLMLAILFPAANASAAPTMSAGGTPASGSCACDRSPCALVAATGKSYDLTDVVVANATALPATVTLAAGFGDTEATPIAVYSPPPGGTVTHTYATAIRANQILNAFCTPASAGVSVSVSGVLR